MLYTTKNTTFAKTIKNMITENIKDMQLGEEVIFPADEFNYYSIRVLCYRFGGVQSKNFPLGKYKVSKSGNEISVKRVN